MSFPKVRLAPLAVFLTLLAVSYSWWVLQRPTEQVQPVDEPQTSVAALIVPHHNLIIDLFQSFYDSFEPSEKQAITQVILLGPNHFEPEEQSLKSAHTAIVYPKDQVMQIDTSLLPSLEQLGVVFDNAVFLNEHAVLLHLPLIAKNFPNATVTPVLITRNITKRQLDELAIFIKKIAVPNKTVIIVSSDFSHNLPFATAQQNDDETIEMIMKSDKDALLSLRDEHVDCSSCLYILSSIQQDNPVKPELIFHGNAVSYAQIPPNGGSTSYVVLRW